MFEIYIEYGHKVGGCLVGQAHICVILSQMCEDMLI